MPRGYYERKKKKVDNGSSTGGSISTVGEPVEVQADAAIQDTSVASQPSPTQPKLIVTIPLDTNLPPAPTPRFEPKALVQSPVVETPAPPALFVLFIYYDAISEDDISVLKRSVAIRYEKNAANAELAARVIREEGLTLPKKNGDKYLVMPHMVYGILIRAPEELNGA